MKPLNQTLNGSLKILDSLRGLAALYVLVHHARLLLTKSYYEGYLKHQSDYTLFDTINVYFFSFFKFGNAAVVLFFVLSGFFIHLKKAKLNEQEFKFDIFDYLKKRIIRIYPTLIFIFIISFLLDLILIQIKIESNSSLKKYGFNILIDNFFLIPDTASWGNNFSLWSLKHEWAFYILYPFMYYLSKFHISIPFLITLLLFVISFLPVQIPYLGLASSTYIVWWFGVLLAEVYVGNLKISLSKMIYLIPVSSFLIIINSLFLLEFDMLILGLLFVGFISFLLIHQNNKFYYFLFKLSFTGDFSYSIYLMHFPIFMFLLKCYQTTNNSLELPSHFGLVYFGIFISIPIIYGLFLTVEKPFLKMKNKFQ